MRPLGLRAHAVRRAHSEVGAVMKRDGFHLSVRSAGTRTWRREVGPAVQVVTAQAFHYEHDVLWDFAWGALFPEAAERVAPLVLPVAHRLRQARLCALEPGYGPGTTARATSRDEVDRLVRRSIRRWEEGGRSELDRLAEPRAVLHHLRSRLSRLDPGAAPEWQGFVEAASLCLMLGERRRAEDMMVKMLEHHLLIPPRVRPGPAHWAGSVLRALGWARRQGLEVPWPEGFEAWLDRCYELQPGLLLALLDEAPAVPAPPRPASWVAAADEAYAVAAG